MMQGTPKCIEFHWPVNLTQMAWDVWHFLWKFVGALISERSSEIRCKIMLVYFAMVFFFVPKWIFFTFQTKNWYFVVRQANTHAQGQERRPERWRAQNQSHSVTSVSGRLRHLKWMHFLHPAAPHCFLLFFCSFAGFRRMEINAFWVFLARQTLSNGLGWLTLR